MWVVLAICVQCHNYGCSCFEGSLEEASQDGALSEVIFMPHHDRSKRFGDLRSHVIRSIIANNDLIHVFSCAYDDLGNSLLFIVGWDTGNYHGVLLCDRV